MPRTATRTRARRTNPPQSEALLSFCRHCETIFEPSSSPIPDVCPECAEIDLLDARMFEMDYALKNTAPGGFTERIWSLERKLYKREGAEK